MRTTTTSASLFCFLLLAPHLLTGHPIENGEQKEIQKRDWKDYAKAGLVGAGLAAGSVGAYKLYQNLKNGQQPPAQPAAGGGGGQQDEAAQQPKGRK